jgi:hypothetical protein
VNQLQNETSRGSALLGFCFAKIGVSRRVAGGALCRSSSCGWGLRLIRNGGQIRFADALRDER